MKREFDPEKDGDLNRDDSGTEKKRTAKTSPDGEDSQTSFARDKRPRIRRVTETLNERVPRERRERPEHEEGGETERRTYVRREQPASEEDSRPRRSYNPNFTEDNRRRTPYGDSQRNDRPDNRDRYDRNNRGNYNRPDDRNEEDDRFNSYNYDREKDNRPGGNFRDRDSQGYNRNYRNNDRDSQGGNRNFRNDTQGGTRNYRNNDRDAQGGNRNYRNNDRAPQGGNRGYRNDRDSQGGNRNYRNNDRQGGRPGDNRKGRPQQDKGLNVFKTPKGGYDSEFQPKVYPTYAAAKIDEPIRLNKYISMSGLSSRREADEFIKQGEITVNGEVVTELGVKIDPNAEVRHNGTLLQGEKRVYILMNKPKGFVTTVEDPNAEKTVMDIVKNACHERVYPVGRLDKNSLGVLLITNDGELTKKLTHPSHEKKKIYQVALDRSANMEDLEKLYDGVELDDGMAVADEVSFLDETKREVGIVIHSGRNRIVRRMFEQLGYHVQKLDRVYFAGLTKKGLRRGAWRYLTPKEVAMLKSGSYE